MLMDRVEKHIDLKAPVSRVWRALTDSKEFGTWFMAKLETPFVAGESSLGKVLYPGYEHLTMEFSVVEIQPESYFSYRWHPYAMDSAVDYSEEPMTLVEFRLAEMAGGTRLTVTEVGFEKLFADRREKAFKANDGGWAMQLKNIERHVGG